MYGTVILFNCSPEKVEPGKALPQSVQMVRKVALYLAQPVAQGRALREGRRRLRGRHQVRLDLD